MLHSFKNKQLTNKEAGKVLGGWGGGSDCAQIQAEIEEALACGDLARAKMLMKQAMAECDPLM